jgi:sulfite exporter TauE/SafE
MSYFPLAFLMGLLGSLHCALMCGPIMLSMPLNKSEAWKNAMQLLLYQLGRIFIYTFLGILVGFVGNSFQLLVNQKVLSVIIGIGLLLFGILQLSSQHRNKLSTIQLSLFKPLSKVMGKMLTLRFWGFFVGMLNGLIPCGMVYLALATALNLADVQQSAQYMFLFGLGTTPLMLMISLGKVYLKKYISFNTKKLIPYFMIFLGLVFVLRSADLGISFFSPYLGVGHQAGALECR